MAKPITVKCYLSTFRNEGIEIRRFLYKSSNDPTIQQLKDDVKQLYPQLRGEKFELMYLDDDNDKIALSTDAELDLAWKEIKAAATTKAGSGPTFRLHIYAGM